MLATTAGGNLRIFIAILKKGFILLDIILIFLFMPDWETVIIFPH